MEIAAYPVPYANPALPYDASGRQTVGDPSNLPRRRHSTPAADAVLQGELLGKTRQDERSKDQPTREYYEHQFRQQTPDLSGLDTPSRTAIQAYLEHADISNPLHRAKHLIDEYV